MKCESRHTTFGRPVRVKDMERNTLTRMPCERRTVVAGLSNRDRVRELARLLGTDAGSVAEGLVVAVERDPLLKRSPALHHAA